MGCGAILGRLSVGLYFRRRSLVGCRGVVVCGLRQGFDGDDLFLLRARRDRRRLGFIRLRHGVSLNRVVVGRLCGSGLLVGGGLGDRGIITVFRRDPIIEKFLGFRRD